MPKHLLRLLALSRAGLINLNDPVAGEAGGGDAAAGAAAAAAPAAPTPADQAAAAAAAKPATDGDGLPTDVDALHKMIGDLRKENAASRTNAKQQAADDAKKELAQQIGKALGIIEGEETPTAEQLTAQLTSSQAAATQSAIELAVYKTASQHGGNPAALTDSRAFLAKVQGLDPTAEDFQQKVTDAAKTAVTENQALKAVQATGQSTVDIQGNAPGDRPKQPASLEAAVNAAYASKPK